MAFEGEAVVKKALYYQACVKCVSVSRFVDAGKHNSLVLDIIDVGI